MENKRSQILLDGAWRFNIDRRETGEENGWHSPAYSEESNRNGWPTFSIHERMKL